MGVNIGKRPSLYSDKHGGVKVNFLLIVVSYLWYQQALVHKCSTSRLMSDVSIDSWERISDLCRCSNAEHTIEADYNAHD